MSKKLDLNIKGIHCKSCKTLIETEVGALKGVKEIRVDHLTGRASLELSNELTDENLINKTIEKLGYSVGDKKKDAESKGKNVVLKYFLLGFALLFFIFGYFAVLHFGGFELLSRLSEKNVSYSLVILIGFLASFHCVGMCGGLVITYSANEAKNKNKKPFNSHFQYNLGRLISYTIIGGILGGFGSFFGINPSFSGFVLLIAGLFMILMGLSILTHFKWLGVVKVKTPEFIARFIYKNKKSDKPKGPLVIGLLTGFMPCGPLQAMQLFALTTGSIFEGSMAMFLYALGTIPLMFGFGSVISAISNSKLKQIMKFSGAIVLILGVFMINRGLVNFGMGFDAWAAKGVVTTTESKTNIPQDVQVVEMDVTYSGYKPNVIYIKKDVPVKWIIKDKGITGCTNEIYLYHENGTIKKKLNQKENIIEFTPTKLGELKFSCWMSMVWGKFIVTEDGGKKTSDLGREVAEISPSAGACAGCANAATCTGHGEGGDCVGEGDADVVCGGEASDTTCENVK